MGARLQHIESLLKARKLDVTLTSVAPWTTAGAADELAPTGVAALDDELGGGFRRGQVSEVVGGRSSGRTSVAIRALAEAAGRGELVALVDASDRFDPVSAAAAGLDLSQLLWVRDTGDVSRAIKATNLILQAGGFGLVVLDLADVPAPQVRGLPFTTWFRLSRVIEGSPTVALLVAAEHVARSAGGATVMMDRAKRPALWTGERSPRARLLTGLDVRPRVVRS